MKTHGITLPQLPDVPHVDVSGVGDRVGDVSDRVGDLATELASAARERAGELAAAAAELLEDVPDKALTIAAAAIPALRPAPRRSKAPFVLLVVAVVATVGGIWFWRRRASDSIAPTTAGSSAEVRSPAAVTAVS